MCICFIYFTNNPNSKIKFIILFNREEFLKRPAESLGFHPINRQSQDFLLYPLDVPTQGTFLCLNTKNGNFCFLLNNPLKSNSYNPNCKLKRGSLPLEFCKLDDRENSWNDFFEKLNEDKAEYNGFNILCGNFKKGIVKYYTNNSEDIRFNAENFVENERSSVIKNNEINNNSSSSKIFISNNKNNNIDNSNENIENELIKKSNRYDIESEVINPIAKSEFEAFNSKIAFDLKEEKTYVVSNTFIFDGDKRVNFGGKIFKDILNKYNLSHLNYIKLDIACNEELIIPSTKPSNENKNEKNYEQELNELIKTLFSSLLGNKEKLENTHDEVLKILRTEQNYIFNQVVDDYVSSSLFIDDKIDDFYIEYGTRNSIAVVVDNQNLMKIFYLDDKVIQEDSRLTKSERDLDKDILKMQFKL